MTWGELVRAAGFPAGMEDFALWNLSSYPFGTVRGVWYDLRHSWRLSQRAGRWNESPDGGFR